MGLLGQLARGEILAVFLILPAIVGADQQRDLVKDIVASELEHMKDMTPEQSRSYLRTWGTQNSMTALGLFLEGYKLKNGVYPRATSMTELEKILSRDYASRVEKSDKWGTEFRYVVSNDGRTYQLISAGADTRFDEQSWKKRGTFASSEEDAVLQDGQWLRQWSDRPVPASRYASVANPRARALLEQADEQSEAKNETAAIASYMEAVKIEPAAAGMDTINRLATSLPVRVPALRQYVQIHPNDQAGLEALLFAVEPEEALAMVNSMLNSRPSDPELWAARARAHARMGRPSQALDDATKAAELDSKNAERYYTAGLMAYEVAKQDAKLTPAQKIAVIGRGLASLDRADALRADYVEVLGYRSLLLRQQAALETDPARQKKLIEEADALRKRMIEAFKKKRTQ